MTFHFVSQQPPVEIMKLHLLPPFKSSGFFHIFQKIKKDLKVQTFLWCWLMDGFCPLEEDLIVVLKYGGRWLNVEALNQGNL